MEKLKQIKKWAVEQVMWAERNLGGHKFGSLVLDAKQEEKIAEKITGGFEHGN